MLQSRQFTTNNTLRLFAAGALQLKPFKHTDRLFLAGLTLTVTYPAGACVFTGNAGEGLTLAEAQSQLTAAITTLRLELHDGVLYLAEVTPTTGIRFDATSQPARAALGVPAAGALESKRIFPLNSARAPHLVAITSEGHEKTLWWEDSAEGSLASSAGGTSIDAPSGGHTALSPPSRAIYVGGTGDVVVHRVADAAATYTTYKAVPVGTRLDVVADSIRSQTTATFLVIEQY